MSESDPNVWSGRALQGVFVEVAVAVLHQCIRSLIGAGLLRTIMDISALAISLADRPQRAIWVTSVGMRRQRPPKTRTRRAAEDSRVRPIARRGLHRIKRSKCLRRLRCVARSDMRTPRCHGCLQPKL